MRVFPVSRSQPDITAQDQFRAFGFVSLEVGTDLFKHGKCLPVADSVGDARCVIVPVGAFIGYAPGAYYFQDIFQQRGFGAADADHKLTMFATVFPG